MNRAKGTARGAARQARRMKDSTLAQSPSSPHFSQPFNPIVLSARPRSEIMLDSLL